MTHTGNEQSPAVDKRLYGLDHLRALAITIVFIFHYGRIFPHPEWTNTISKFGWTGVDLFFVLSGYLIASQLFTTISFGHPVPLKEFFVKRFFRIIPGYLLIVALYFCFPFMREREGPAPLWKYLSFTQNIGLDLRTQGTFSHAWSLCIEEQFYLLLPVTLAALLYFKFFKRSGWLLVGLFIASFIGRYLLYQQQVAPFLEDDDSWVRWYKWIYYPTWCRLDGLLVGVSIAAIFRFRPYLKERILKYSNWFLLTGIIILAAAYYICLDEESFEASVFGFPLVSLGYGCMLIGAINPAGFLHKFRSGITATIATWSYAIYLSHKIVVHVMQEQFARIGVIKESNIMFLLCMVASLGGAFIMHRLIEQPALKIRNKVLAAKPVFK